MGACVSSAGLTEEDKAKHREAEKLLKDAKLKLASQVKVRPPIDPPCEHGCSQHSFGKVLLLGSGDSGKSTILKVSVHFVLCSVKKRTRRVVRVPVTHRVLGMLN